MIPILLAWLLFLASQAVDPHQLFEWPRENYVSRYTCSGRVQIDYDGEKCIDVFVPRMPSR